MMLAFDVPWAPTNPSVAERAISLMKGMCHLSQCYYSPRKQTVSIIFSQENIRSVCYFKVRRCTPKLKRFLKDINKYDCKNQIIFNKFLKESKAVKTKKT